MDRLRVLLLSRYGARGASSRVRSFQYLPSLRAEGIDVTPAPLFDDGYLERIYAGRRPAWGSIAAAYGARVRRLLGGRRYDVVWVEKELFPWLPARADLALARRARALVVDYDDAIFHRYDAHPRGWVRRLFGRKIDRVMAAADLVVVGNDYLGDRARSAGARRIEILPTVVDTARYVPAPSGRDGFTVGWIGTPRTSRYLAAVAPALAAAKVRVLLVGAAEDALAELDVERRPWTEDAEVELLQSIDAGIMPLPDEPFERGKCGYKLIQYMACGKPVVATPVGVNREIVADGANGFLAESEGEWRGALERLAGDADLRAELGANGRRLVEERYSLAATRARLAALLREAAGFRPAPAVAAAPLS